MSFVNWSPFFSYSFTRSLVEALLKKDSVLTYIALSTVVLLINALTEIYAASAPLWHRLSCVEVAERSNSTLHLFDNLSHSSLTKSFPHIHPAPENPCWDNIRCRCWFYMHTVPTVAHQEYFSLHSLPYPWHVSFCHLHFADGSCCCPVHHSKKPVLRGTVSIPALNGQFSETNII